MNECRLKVNLLIKCLYQRYQPKRKHSRNLKLLFPFCIGFMEKGECDCVIMYREIRAHFASSLHLHIECRLTYLHLMKNSTFIDFSRENENKNVLALLTTLNFLTFVAVLT